MRILAADDEPDMAMVLEALLKPFDNREFTARVRALTRRGQGYLLEESI